MTILPKKTSQRPPGGGGGATAEGSQEHQHPQGGHFNISSQVQESFEYNMDRNCVENVTCDCTPPHVLRLFEEGRRFWMSCAKRDLLNQGPLIIRTPLDPFLSGC